MLRGKMTPEPCGAGEAWKRVSDRTNRNRRIAMIPVLVGAGRTLAAHDRLASNSSDAAARVCCGFAAALWFGARPRDRRGREARATLRVPVPGNPGNAAGCHAGHTSPPGAGGHAVRHGPLSPLR